VLSYDGDTARLYGDGIMLASSYKNWSLILDKVYLGRSVNDIIYWNGAVDDVRIYDKALSDAEILDLYSQHAGNYLAAPTNLVLNQTADQIVELTWQDNSDDEEGFIVERRENGGVFSHLDSLAVNTSSYQDSTVVSGNYYQYRLFAFNASLISDSLVTDSLYIRLYQPNLVAYWKLDNNANDDSGNGINGTTVNDPQFTTSSVVGSHALQFDGVDQYVNFGTPQLPSGRSPRTMSAWLKTNDVSYDYRFAVAYGKAAVSSAMFIGQRGTELIGGSNADGLAVNDFWEIDTWHHVVLSYDGDTARLYGDGIMLASSYKNWSLILDKVYLGRSVTDIIYWNGAVDDVRIYDKALSDAEILDLYNQNAGNPPAAPTNLVVNQTEDQKVELTWQDNSDNEDGFIVERSENGSVFSHLDSLGVNTNSYQDSTVVPGNYYQYRLFAFNASLNSDTLFTDSLYILYKPNLVAHWELDNSPTDASGNNIHGTINGNPQYVNSAIVGSHAIEFNGVDQYIDFGNPTQLPSGRSPRTMSAWLKTNDVSNSNRFAVAYGMAAVNSAMVLGQSGTQLIGGGYGDAINVNGFWEIGTWHHIVLTYDGDTAKLYADGNMLTSSYMNWSLVLDKVYVGRQVNDLKYWNGYVDDVRIYNKVLSDAEILDLYNQHAGNPPAAPTNLVINQTADQKVEITWQDNSDNEDGFIIERKITEDNLFTILGSVPADTTNYIDTSVASNTSYDYRIKAHNATDSSAYSDVTSVFVQTITALIPPTKFQLLKLYNSKADFMWSHYSPGELGFIVQRKDGISGYFAPIDTLAANSNFYTDATILEDTIYSYRVAAFNAFGLSDFSEVITFQAYDQGIVLDSIEYSALESLYNALDGENWFDDYNWLNGYRSEDFASWYGLTVEEGDVVGIDLSYNNLTGEIPEEFCQLGGLRGDLRLEGNYLTGSYPTNYGNLGLGGYGPPELYLTDNKLTHLREVQGINHVLYNVLTIKYNQIEFGSLEQYASQWHYVEYNPQNDIGEADTLEVVSGSDVQVGSGIGGAYTSWQWQKLVNDVWQDIIGETDSAIAITEINASHEGVYRCVATNTQFSDLTLYTAIKAIKVTVDENYDQIPDTQELQTLTAIYNQLDGNNWTNKTNWLNGITSADFSNWHGITVENGDVTEINLGGNNLQGEIPPEIQQLGSLRVLKLNSNQLKGEIPVQLARLTNLEELYLNDNQLEGYMDLEFSVMPNIRVMALQNNNLVSIPDFSFNNSVDPLQVTLNAENNKLEFYYIENNLNTDGSDILGTFTYMPQKIYGEPRILGFIEGNELLMKVNMLGRANHYQWQFSPDQGQSWADKGADNPEYTETGIGESHEGWYRVRITNDRADEAGDEIVSAIYNVRIEKAPVVVNRPID
jgi:hypothetical protein